MAERKARVERNTLETQITVEINLDGTGKANFDTGVPFLEHMMDQIARHGLVDLDIICKGDLHIDDHHTVEDIGITLGQAFKQAVGDKKGIRRYGHAYVPPWMKLCRAWSSTCPAAPPVCSWTYPTPAPAWAGLTSICSQSSSRAL